ncbi:40795_t:CDS:2 [Gigaspora margarita]|uniref:40795_t:CDS:1 n=1 Tax=Gigaspora margarita TaxID=4874 RepID=A0ABN7UE51_GIGMA|nr:40795_t:CDS:2 [Gigaspora margarita]
MQNLFKELFKFGSKDTNTRPKEQNVYEQKFVERYKTNQECLDLTEPSTGSATSNSTQNNDLESNVNQPKNNTKLKENSNSPNNSPGMYDKSFMKSFLNLKNELKLCREQLQEHKLKLETKDEEISKLCKEKNNEMSNLYKELEAKDKETLNLHKIIEDLKNEASRHQSALGKATNFRLSDDDRNNSVQLREDITYLQKTIKDFCIVKPGIEINETEAKKLLQQYGSNNLITKMKHFANFREGDDDVTKAFPVKLRQQIYAVLGNRGFSKVLSEDTIVEHPLINDIQQQLIQMMNRFRTVNDPGKAIKLNNMVANIVRDVIKIFFFRLKVQEPVADPPRWFEHNDQVNPDLMEGTFDQDADCQDVVKICSFPLIGIDLDDEKKRKTLIPAIVHTATIL